MLKNIEIGVIGAGPSGITTVGSLLERGYTNITWIDPYFQAGEFRNFWGIPANTHSWHLSVYANFLKTFSDHAEDPLKTTNVFEHYELTEIANLDDLKLCLTRMKDIIQQQHPQQVTMIKDLTQEIIQHQGYLELKFQQNKPIKLKKLFVCIGSEAKKMNIFPNVQRLNIYHMMSPFAIEKYDLTNDIVDVYGSRNSALLVLNNLMAMQKPPKLVRHFLNKKLIHAEYVDDFIRHNFTGLKGVASDFGLLYQEGKYKGRILMYQYDPKHIVEGATKIIQAVGFEPKKIQFTDRTENKGYMLKDCQMYRRDGSRVENIHFVGFVNPQTVTDKEGEVMRAVGVHVFMEHSLAIIDQWETPSKL